MTDRDCNIRVGVSLMQKNLAALVDLVERERKKPALLMVYAMPQIVDRTQALLEAMALEIDCQRNDLDLIAAQLLKVFSNE